jgi:AcrR family transcriptional regulator
MARAFGEAGVPRGRHGLPPDAVAAQQRERLIRATVDLVGEQGYQRTSIDQIVRSAQVGYAAFYDLFGSKEDCLLAAFDQIAEETAALLAASATAADDWPRRIAASLACLQSLLVDQPERARLALVEIQAAGPRARARYEEVLSRAVPKLREGRAHNANARELSPLLEEALLGGMAWLVHERLLEGELEEENPLLDELVEIASSPYLDG